MTTDGTKPKRGRPKSIARQVAEDTGMNLRTVQRVLAAGRPQVAETDADATLRRFIETFRNFATFCRENSPEKIAGLHVSEDQAERLREWNDIVVPWLRQLNEG